MDITWAGVVFIWVLYLWPILLAIGYLMWKKAAILKKGRFFLVSITVGYVFFLVGSIISPIFLFAYLKISDDTIIGVDEETIITIFTAVITAALLILPVLTTHYIAKRFS